MSSDVDVVITGLGLVSPIGVGANEFWNSLMAGRSGIAPITGFDAQHLETRIAGEIHDFNPKEWVKPRKSLKVMCPEIQRAFASATMAMRQAGLEAGSVAPDRLGVIFGAEMIYSSVLELDNIYKTCLKTGEFDFTKWGNRAPNEVYPLWMLKYLPNMPACHIGIAVDARGPNNSIVHGDVSSLQAFIEAYEVIRRGQADAMIVGGTGTRLNLTQLMWRGPDLLSRRNDDPEAAVRPFDADRDGTVNAEGAAAFILESAEHAQNRGATVLAQVASHALGYDPPGKSIPKWNAFRAGMGRALKSAGIAPADLGHVNANGLGMVDEDAQEAQAIRDVVGDVPVTALKGYFGHLGASSGAVEMVASVQAFTHNLVPATLNYETPDDACPINVVAGQAMADRPGSALVVSQARTGQFAAVVLRSP